MNMHLNGIFHFNKNLKKEFLALNYKNIALE